MAKERFCGSCSECCTVLAVEEIGKPADVPCQFLVPSNGQGCCGVYDDQPPHCRRFKCGWLVGNFPQKFRPDRIGLVVFQTDSEVGKGIMIAESRPGALEGAAAQRIQQEVEAAGMLVIKREAPHQASLD
jgi:hypothetical protein